MFSFVVVIHVVACILLALVILMQSGRGGGLTEQFASAESLFGAKTNAFMVRITTVLAVIFLVTSLSLAFMSSKRDKSLMPSQGAVPKSVEQGAGIPEGAVPANVTGEQQTVDDKR
ncbi:MAG: preprotein translocase subunit SecG [Candidatus Omnitrophota bacterium]